MNEDLMKAILALDSYNRGYNAGINFGNDPDNSEAINDVTQIGTATIFNSNNTTGAQNESFYAIAYSYNGEVVISYRGTDSVLGDAAAFEGAIGEPWTAQAELSIQFYKDIDAATSTDISVTGHSLGGGLAGLVGAVYHQEGALFDNMAFEQAAENLYDLAVTIGYNKEFVYGAATPWTPFAYPGSSHTNEMHGYAIEGEFVGANRLTQETSVQTYTFNEEVELPQWIDSGLLGGGLHSMATLIIRMYAEKVDIGGTDWQNIAPYFFPVLYNDDLAEHIGFGGSGTGGVDDAATKLRSALAYSVIDEGVRIYGDTGIRALYDDANEYGTAVGTSGSPKILTELGEEISQVFVQFAGHLAFQKVLQSDDADAVEGIFDADSGRLVISFADSRWNVSSAGAPEIVAREELIDKLFIYGVNPKIPTDPLEMGEIESAILTVQYGMTYAWGSSSYGVIEQIVLPYSVTDGLVASQAASEGHATLLYAAADNITTIAGSSGDDLIFAGNFNQAISSSGGSDVIYGGNGVDTIKYTDSANAVSVTLDGRGNAAVEKDAGEKDALVNIEEIAGSQLNDQFIVTGLRNGALDGQGGSDTIDLSQSKLQNIRLDLGSGYVRNAIYTFVNGTPVLPDSLSLHSIENAIGSNYSDTLTGSSERNSLTGGTGSDVLIGGLGADVFIFNSGDGKDEVLDYDHGQKDHLRYNGGITANSLVFSRGAGAGADDEVIRVGGDTVILKNFFDGPGDQNFHVVTVEFDSGVVDFLIGPDGSVISMQSQTSTTSTSNTLGIIDTGGSGQDSLFGTTGRDTLDGAGDNDTLVGQSGSTDLLIGGSGSDLIVAGDGNDRLYGDTYAENTYSNSGDDVIFGGAGNDTISPGGGNNLVHAGAGDDVVRAPSLLSTASGGVNEIYGEGGDDTLYAYGGVGDFIDGGENDDHIIAYEGGANTLVGGSGDDLIEGDGLVIDGIGVDYYNIGTGTIIAAADRQFDTFQTGGDATLDLSASHLGFTLTMGSGASSNNLQSADLGAGTVYNFEVIKGGSGDDQFKASAANLIAHSLTYNTIDGGAGNDYLEIFKVATGGSGADTFVTTAYHSVSILDYSYKEQDDLVINNLDEGFGHTPDMTDIKGIRVGDDLHIDTATSTLGSEAIYVDMKGFFLQSSKYHYVVIDFEGDSLGKIICEVASDGTLTPVTTVGAFGNDTLSSSGGGDTLEGFGGSDYLLGNPLGNTLDGGPGADIMIAGDGNDAYVVDNTADVVSEAVSAGTDTVYASVSYQLSDNVENLVLTGNAANEGYGNALANEISGNIASNRLFGGEGSDTYIYAYGGGQDSISDTGGTLDTVVFGSGMEDDVVYGRIGDDLVISFDDSGSVSIVKFFTDADTVEEISYLGGATRDSSYLETHLDYVAGTSGDDTMAGTSGADNLLGLDGEDQIAGGDGEDTLNGGIGNDVLEGGDDGDTYSFSEGSGEDIIEDTDGTSDVIFFDSSVDVDSVIYAQDGDDLFIRYGNMGDSITVTDYFVAMDTIEEITFADSTSHDWVYINAHLEALAGTAGDDTISGTIGDDELLGYDGNDTLRGFAGNDTLDGGAGADTLAGGQGNDTYIVDGADFVSESGGEGTDTVLAGISYTLAANFENLVLTGSSNVNGTGNSGNNTLAGNSGTNALTGGAGDDTYIVSTGDTVSENSGEGTDTVVTDVAYTLGADLENLVLTGSSNVNGSGNSADNTLAGNSGINTLAGGAGNDTYIIGTGDVVTEGSGQGTDTVQADVTYTLAANIENLALTGVSGINGTGNSSANSIAGNSGNNTLDGGAGDDTLAGGLGDDTYVIDSLSDIVIEDTSSGFDTVRVGITGYTLGADLESLLLTGSGNINGTGNSTNNVVTGNSGTNTLYGMDGNDTLDGGAGADRMEGGAGNDVYYVDNVGDKVFVGSGIDTVYSSVEWTPNWFDDGSSGMGVSVVILTGSANINASIWGAPDLDFSTITLVGNSGINTLTGGFGGDTFYVSTGDIVVAGGGTDHVYSDVTYSIASNSAENLTLTGTTNINATGSSVANTLTGNSGTNTLTGGAGNDTYIVGAGDVVVENAAEGTDSVYSDVTYVITDADVENLILTGAASIDATGNSSANTLTGNSGANILTGGAGNDTYNVGAGDTVSENVSEGTDTVISGLSWTLGSNIENLTLSGSANINGTGNSTGNTITGNSGINTLSGGLGDDTYIIGADDTISENSGEGTDTVHIDATYTLGANLENLTLTGSANINGHGNGGVNTLTGNAGNNTLDGAAGADTMLGGAGDDVYIIDNAGDIANETGGSGIDTVVSSISFTLGSGLEALILSGTGDTSGTGNSSVNAITGNSGNNTLDGGSGSDTLAGGDGDDIYIVESAGDILIEGSGAGTDVARSSAASYTLGTNVEHLVLTGTASINGTGNGGNNSITGNTGANTLDGGAGDDTLAAGNGNDAYVVDSLGDVLVENASEGTDIVYSGISYSLALDFENLTLTGSGHINGTGNSAANTIIGNSGNNTLDGSSGADNMAGGAGDDVYIVDNASDAVSENSSAGTDTVQSSITYTITDADIENLSLTGSGNINGTGNAGNNTLTGNSGTNTLAGGDGDDVYVISAGDIVVENGSEGTDTVFVDVTYSLTANVENLTLTGSGNINGTGSAVVNTLVGNSGNNTLDGAAGADTMSGGTGDDIYIVSVATDRIIENASEGIDTVRAIVAFSLASLDDIENIVMTGTGMGTGNAGNNTLDGSQSGSVNSLVGGAGDDIYIVGAGDLVVETSGQGTDNVYSDVTYAITDADVENLTLTGVLDIDADGNASNNTLTGNSGANILDGMGGTDVLAGGAGNDTYVVDTTSDTISEDTAAGTDTVTSSVTFSLALIANVENLTLTGTTVNGTGNALENVITGSASVNTLDGGDGDDYLIGNNGNDYLAGGTDNGNDTLDGGIGNDTMIGGNGNDVYMVNVLTDVVSEGAAGGTDTVHAALAFSLASYANIENLVMTAAGAGTGNSGDNTLDGSQSANANALLGGAGNDTYIVGSGDTVTENSAEGTDNVFAAVTYTISNVNVENLTLTGVIDINGTGNSSNNTLTGNSGANTLDGQGGIDVLIGGGGDDVYIVDTTSDTISENGMEGNDTVSSSVTFSISVIANVENVTLTGTSGIHATGNSLDNTLTGNSGANTLTGGAGNDVYVVGTGDIVVENSGEGTDEVRSSITYTLGNYLENLVLTGTTVNGTGNGLDNAISGTANINTLDGQGGNDTLDGGAAADTMIGGTGDDTYIISVTTDKVVENSGEGTDTVLTDVTGYTLAANAENLVLRGSVANGTGNASNNVMTGNAANNILTGADGSDTLDGGAGNDTLIGGLGDDIFIVDSASDVVSEAASQGIDTVHSSVTFSFSSLANLEHLVLTGAANINGTGNAGANTLVGNSGANSLDGGAGNDILDGGSGLDTLTGGSNADIFVFKQASYGGIDTVTDFNTAQSDVLDIKDMLIGYSGSVTDWVRVSDSGGNSIVEIDRDGTGGSYGWAQVATLSGVTGLTDEAALVTNGNLLVA